MEPQLSGMHSGRKCYTSKDINHKSMGYKQMQSAMRALAAVWALIANTLDYNSSIRVKDRSVIISQ